MESVRYSKENYQPQPIYAIRSPRVSRFNAPLFFHVCHGSKTAWRNCGDWWYDNHCLGEYVTTMMHEPEELGVGEKRKIERNHGREG